MSLEHVLDSKKGMWATPNDNIVAGVMIPALSNSSIYDCMAGFFTSSSISELSHGLALFLQKDDHIMRLLISPIIDDSDMEAFRIADALSPQKAVEWAFIFLGGRTMPNETDLERHTRQCLAYLLACNRLQIKIVVTSKGQFHRKNFIFSDRQSTACLAGSANLTFNGLCNNHETMQLNCDWKDQNQKDVCDSICTDFTNYWNNSSVDACTVEISTALRSNILRNYSTEIKPAYSEYQTIMAEETSSIFHANTKSQSFSIPETLIWESGSYKHQGAAVHAWEDSNYNGIISLATGGGKTLTSLICAQRLFERLGRLNIVISVPTKPLAFQWKDECKKFGLQPLTATDFGSVRDHLSDLQIKLRALDRGKTNIVCSIILNGTLKRRDFQRLINRVNLPTLLIADECHNLGSDALLRSLPSCVEYRLGLSATPIRQYDIEGSHRLVEYFGQTVFELSLKDAIGICLVPYDYYVETCFLSEDECTEYAYLTEKLKPLFGRMEKDSMLSAEVKRLLIRRSRIIESTQSKIAAFAKCVANNTYSLKRAIVFCTAKNASQLQQVNSILKKSSIPYHQLTQVETAQTSRSSEIIQDFREGRLDILTSKQVLNEGANIPEVETAYFLGSSTVEREWIQRRGRVLRTSPATNKANAFIIDFLAIPPLEFASECSSAVRKELDRCDEFSMSSRNLRSSDSGRMTMERLKSEYLY